MRFKLLKTRVVEYYYDENGALQKRVVRKDAFIKRVREE